MAKVALEVELEQLAQAIMNLPPKNVSGFGVCSPLWRRRKIRVPLRPFANRKPTRKRGVSTHFRMYLANRMNEHQVYEPGQKRPAPASTGGQGAIAGGDSFSSPQVL